jgi:sec-independent protein translocase protein TatA
MFGLGPFEMVVIGVIAVLLFGANLPDVARKFGGSYREFRRGLNDVQQQFRVAEHEVKKTFTEESSSQKSSDETDEDDDESSVGPSAPKFTPPS